jgi:hypothetical protein
MGRAYLSRPKPAPVVDHHRRGLGFRLVTTADTGCGVFPLAMAATSRCFTTRLAMSAAVGFPVVKRRLQHGLDHRVGGRAERSGSELAIAPHVVIFRSSRCLDHFVREFHGEYRRQASIQSDAMARCASANGTRPEQTRRGRTASSSSFTSALVHRHDKDELSRDRHIELPL